jgi:hypothetical protein
MGDELDVSSRIMPPLPPLPPSVNEIQTKTAESPVKSTEHKTTDVVQDHELPPPLTEGSSHVQEQRDVKLIDLEALIKPGQEQDDLNEISDILVKDGSTPIPQEEVKESGKDKEVKQDTTVKQPENKSYKEIPGLSKDQAKNYRLLKNIPIFGAMAASAYKASCVKEASPLRKFDKMQKRARKESIDSSFYQRSPAVEDKRAEWGKNLSQGIAEKQRMIDAARKELQVTQDPARQKELSNLLDKWNSKNR